MKSILKVLTGLFKGGVSAFSRYPASMVCSLVVVIAATILIYSENTMYDDMLHSIQLAFVFGAILNMAITAYIQKKDTKPLINIVSGAIGIAISVIVFLLLYIPSKEILGVEASRILVGSLIALLLFILIPTAKNKKLDFNQMLFMTLKSYFIAQIYALVIMLGLYFIVFTVQSLLLNDLSYKIYQYTAVYSMLAGYAFFLGYFPLFNKNENEERIEKAVKHPGFIEFLFQYILIPIMTTLTVVLFIWAIRIIVEGVWPEFNRLSAIFASYSLFGILLYLFISSYTTQISIMYKKIIPYSILLFAVFNSYAIIKQLTLFGLKTPEFFTILIWLFSIVVSGLFIYAPIVKNRIAGYIAIVLLAVSVMPIIGYADLPVSMQLNRLKNVLVKNDMLLNNAITPNENIEDKDKETITDAAEFLSSNREAKTPEWFVNHYDTSIRFKDIYGFEQIHGGYDIGHDMYQYVVMNLETGYIDISDYDYFVNYRDYGDDVSVSVIGKKGTYIFDYSIQTKENNYPYIVIKKDVEIVFESDLKEFFITLYNNNKVNSSNTPRKQDVYSFDDMTYKGEAGGIKFALVFQSINIDSRTNNSEPLNVYAQLKGIYIDE